MKAVRRRVTPPLRNSKPTSPLLLAVLTTVQRLLHFSLSILCTHGPARPSVNIFGCVNPTMGWVSTSHRLHMLFVSCLGSKPDDNQKTPTRNWNPVFASVSMTQQLFCRCSFSHCFKSPFLSLAVSVGGGDI